MRFKSRTARWKEFHARVRHWHLWFAWRPVLLVDQKGDSTGAVAWFETVARRERTAVPYPSWEWEYAEKTMVLVESPKRRYTD